MIKIVLWLAPNRRYFARPISLFLVFAFLSTNYGCQKIEYTEIENPAYLRVFNSLNLPDVIETGVIDSLPYLCMLINPIFDAVGNPIDAEIVGDFLDRRDKYAPPFPQHIGASTTLNNPEYPGKESVLVGPVLNGFDLSSWAQVPAGELEVLFMFRPRNEIPFFELNPNLQNRVAARDKITLNPGEVYTMQVLYEEFYTRKRRITLRQEIFHKQSFSDSLVYVNFYNYSSENYNGAEMAQKLPNGRLKKHLFEGGIRDTMDVFLTVMQGEDFLPYAGGVILRNSRKATQSIDGKYLYTMKRMSDGTSVAPYLSFPLWINDDSDGISTDLWQRFYFITPGMGATPNHHPFSEYGEMNNHYSGGPYVDSKGAFAVLNCLLDGRILYVNPDNSIYHVGVDFPNLIVSTHSGRDNPRSFATVNTFEIINGEVYLTSIQRKYAPPLY